MEQIKLKRKYRVYHGMIKRGAPIGNGDSGKRAKKHKLPEKQKRLLVPRKTTLHIDATGKRRWIHG